MKMKKTEREAMRMTTLERLQAAGITQESGERYAGCSAKQWRIGHCEKILAHYGLDSNGLTTPWEKKSHTVERLRGGPFPSTPPAGDERDCVSGPLPYAHEVRAWERADFWQGCASQVEKELTARVVDLEAQIKEKDLILQSLAKLFGGRLPTEEGAYRAEMIDGGQLMVELNEHLQLAGRDVHRRPGVDGRRRVKVVIDVEPSENSAAVKMNYKVDVDTPASEGTGLAYLDKDGRLVTPRTAEQVMLPLEQKAA